MPITDESLRDLRVRAGWSLRGLAAQTGVAATAIGLIERGKQTPRPVTLRRLAQVFGLDAGGLAARFGQPDPIPTWPDTWDADQMGGELARWRAWAGDSQHDLANAAECAVSMIREVEQGHRLLPVALARGAGARYGFDTAAALAAAGYDTALPAPSRWDRGEFGELWPQLRGLAGVSLSEVADAIGVSKAAVGYWTEQGHEPTDGQLPFLAELLADRLGWHPAIAGLDLDALAKALGRSRRRAAATPPHAGRPRRR